MKGVFEEGAYAGPGAEMAELRAWVLAQLLWNPQQDDRALIKEFLRGYYGKRAGDLIERYLELMHDASQGFYLRCYVRQRPALLAFPAAGRGRAALAAGRSTPPAVSLIRRS